MLSIPNLNDSNKAHGGNLLRSRVSEQSIELSILTEDENALITPSNKKYWKPLTQKAYFLVPTILASGALIAVLQIYLARSNAHSGILFASKINDLPLSQKFPYLYLPTIVSLILSFAWAWLDLDVRRLQPFIELSKEQGACGDDSLLLHYPFDFVAFVPFTAARRRHWPVFTASLAVVIIFWGLTPLQSTIFATRTIEKNMSVATARSTSYLSLQEQKYNLTAEYTQSVYNIAWLNETLPPFMSQQGMLAPFGLLDNFNKSESAETWTAPTKFYSVDLNCESPTYGIKDTSKSLLLSSNGCKYSRQNMVLPTEIKDNEYYSLYVGYWYEESMDSYLLGNCPEQANQTFLIRWSRGQERQAGLDPIVTVTVPKEGTTLWCTSSYYQQDVSATVSAPNMKVLEVVPTGPKLALPADFFNITEFEWGMSQGSDANGNRGTFPSVGIPSGGWPSPYDRLCAKFPDLVWDMYAYLPNMATFALGTYQRPMAEYLNAETLKDSYQAAYRLLFARRLADVLHPDLDGNTAVLGNRRYTTQTIIMVPAFVYVVESMVAVTAAATSVILLLSLWTKAKLMSEPANIASMMALFGSDSCTVQRMSEDDCATSTDLEAKYKNMRFALSRLRSDQCPTICYNGHHDSDSDTFLSVQKPTTSKLILPMELSWAFGIGFLGLQIGLAITLLYLFSRIRTEHGLPLPSTSIFVNQLLENYLPMVLGAFFEPIFTMITRTLCMLQPYEQLRRGQARPERSIMLDYASLPPQAVVFRALKNKHIALAMVSLMTLLSNVLSITFSGLFTESMVLIPQYANFTAGYQFPLNGFSLGNESISRNRPSYDSYYVAASNLTSDTPLPSWTDGQFFYLPFEAYMPSSANITQYKVATPAVKAALHCFPMEQETDDRSLKWSTLDEKTTCDFSLVPNFPNVQNNTPHAIEYVNFTWPVYGKGPKGQATTKCDLSVMAGWGRTSKLTKDGPLNASWIGCIPKLQVELREVTVDMEGRVLSSSPLNSTTSDGEQLFEPNATSLIQSVHKVLDPYNAVAMFYTTNPSWHNDSYPSDFVNYLIAQTTNRSTFLDPMEAPPSFEQAAPLLDMLYSKLFAIILASNVDKVLHPSGETKITTGLSMRLETRIFVQEEMLLVAVAILALFVLVTIVLYIRRPWRILPRLPTTLASQMAFFAASHAMKDLAETSGMSERQRNSYVKGLRQRYGFGKFVGTDGMTHIGVEREPLVQVLTKQDLRIMRKNVLIE
ncbi:hypothetical protein KCU78_g3135, partial [Aureobasidium melanogenum]